MYNLKLSDFAIKLFSKVNQSHHGNVHLK